MPEPSELCAYCLQAELTGKEKPEHPIPASLGSSLTVTTVCDPCNEWAGREIDKPLMEDPLLTERRSMVDQRDPRRGKKARRAVSQILKGETADGDRITWDHDRKRPVMGSRIIEGDDGHTYIRAGSEEEAERLLEIVRKRAAREGKEAKVESIERGKFKPEIKALISMRPEVWRRAAAKIALAVGSEVYPADWRTSADAERLREWMNGRDETTDDGSAPPLIPAVEGDDHPFALGDEHLLFFMKCNDEATYLGVVLFGTMTFGVPVDTTGAAVPTQAWRLDWSKPRASGATTFDDLVMARVEQMQSQTP